MINWFEEALVGHPEIAIFAALAIGFWVGKFTFRGLGLGAVTGTLLAGVVIGALVEVDIAGTLTTIEISDVVKQVFFLLFLFALGYRLGPQFFAGLRGSGAPQALFSVIMLLVGLGVTIVVSFLLDYNPGLGAGLAAGGLTQSSIIGVAQDSISGLSENADTLSEWSDLVPVAYAVTYIFGTIGAAIYCANIPSPARHPRPSGSVEGQGDRTRIPGIGGRRRHSRPPARETSVRVGPSTRGFDRGVGEPAGDRDR